MLDKGRRAFIRLLGGAVTGWPLAAWPLKARAQQVSHVPRVGVLLAEADNQDMQARLERLRQDLELLNPTP